MLGNAGGKFWADYWEEKYLRWVRFDDGRIVAPNFWRLSSSIRTGFKIEFNGRMTRLKMENQLAVLKSSLKIINHKI